MILLQRLRLSKFRFGRKTALFFAVLVTLRASLSATSLAQISVAVATDQPSYVIGEPIQITVTAVNSATEPVVLGFPTTAQSTYVLDNYTPLLIPFQTGTSVTVPATGRFDWSYYYDWNRVLSLGPHQAVGKILDVNPNRASNPISFQIVEPEPVTDDIFIDFETYADGTPVRPPPTQIASPFSSVSYAAWGTIFRSDGGRAVLSQLQGLDGNTVLQSPSFPGPRNVVADFDMPVLAVSADVGAENGHSVVMSAFDAAGNLLATATSDPTTNYPHLNGPLRLNSAVPIASVEWTASDLGSTIRIDNLSLDVHVVPEPSAIVQLIALMALMCLTRAWKRCPGRL
jgi:hypothetical protein